MPELAEVEVVRRNLLTWWRGHAAAEVQVLDEGLAVDHDVLRDALMQRVSDVRRRGKHLIVCMEGGAHVLFHFRMSGKIVRADTPAPSSSARLAWRVDEAPGWLVFKDRRRFAQVIPLSPGELEHHAPITTLGPEPHDVGPSAMRRLLDSTRRLKDRLLDQRVIAGVGNIAISEVFWRLQLPPEIRCNVMTDAQVDALTHALPVYFDWLIDDQMSGEITYLNEGKTTNPFQVYRREGEPCPRCQTPISRLKVGGRSSYACLTCQSS